jgi:serine-type D-Ala-D-Ala carboxypeptidase/endopeptidase (penicillin-binding protein 4)
VKLTNGVRNTISLPSIRFFRTSALPVVLLALAACVRRPPETPVPRRLDFAGVADSLIQASELNSALWGIEVFDQVRNQSVFSYNATRHFIPASNTKVVVTSVALGSHGPDYRYRTEIRAGGGADNGPERLVVVGSGDPTWSSRFYPTDFTVLEQLADSVLQKGIRGVTRELVIDASFFGAERINSTWEVGDLTGGGAAPGGAFVIGEGTLDLEVLPGERPGALATVRILGAPAIFPIKSVVLTDTTSSPANVNVDYQAWPDTIAVSGRVGRQDTTTIAAPNATRYAAAVFAAVLQRKGVQIPLVRVVYDSAEAAELRIANSRPVTSWASEPMANIVAGILQPSQNWMAEQLLRTLGGLARGRGTWSNGLDVERRYLTDVVRLDSTSFFLRDASGLSAQNLLSPQALVRLLEYNRLSPWAQQYRLALPTPGLRGSTLSSRLEGLEGQVYAKTGTITNVGSLSGYLVTRAGRELTFSIMVNASGRSSNQVRRGIDRLVVALAELQ